MRMIIGAFALALAASLAHAERDIYDKCETTLRLCFQRCLDDGVSGPRECNANCNTARCEGIDGPERSLTDFLRWKDTKGKVWL